MELRAQRRLDAAAGLVAGPEIVAKRLDHVVGGDADVRRALLDDLEHRLQHADHGAERPVLALGEAAQAVEVAEQLVGAVDEVNDHRAIVASGGERWRAPLLRDARRTGALPGAKRSGQAARSRTGSFQPGRTKWQV